MAHEPRGGTRPVRRLLIGCMAFQGVSGVAGGIGLVFDPSGETLGIPIEWLAGSMFGDYLVPGLVLLSVLGVVPLVVTWGLWRRRPWARPSSLVVGIGLLIWIAIEVAVIGYQPDPPLQTIYGALGALIVALSLARG